MEEFSYTHKTEAVEVQVFATQGGLTTINRWASGSYYVSDKRHGEPSRHVGQCLTYEAAMAVVRLMAL